MVRDFLDIRRLRYLVAIAETGTLTAAGRSLNIAQPALSYHLKELERMIGGTLFERKVSGMEPTPLGLILIGHAVQIIDRIREAEGDILRCVREDLGGDSIRLTIIPSLAAVLSPVLFRDFRTAFPNHSLHLIDARSSFARELIEKEQADIAVQLDDTGTPQDDILAWEGLYCITLADQGDAPMTFAEVASSNLILPATGNPLRVFLENAAREKSLPLRVSMEVDGFEPRKRMVRAGLGTTVFGEYTISPDVMEPGLVARRIVQPELRRPLVLLSRRGLPEELRSRSKTVLRKVFEVGSSGQTSPPALHAP
ncbi:LysR family transcriptional regulator [Roseitranquillus sediminis]|uniref:LysR family transcriptional regulator n=1 Tax=Roseitranquillus sediminis TaxID=2809051 RepID=UPI001D0C9109|nr:LysR family transcriptional regulator [Roseitranquillus sediminis]MBM9594693.1 LysR family transcriptional regulator [Roseitranquillus sediminis]